MKSVPTLEGVPVKLNHLLGVMAGLVESWPGLSRPSTSFQPKVRKKTWMPATSAGMTAER
jgi:hypothetical protein